MIRFTRRTALIALSCSAGMARGQERRFRSLCLSFENGSTGTAEYSNASSIDWDDDYANGLAPIVGQIKRVFEVNFAYGTYEDSKDAPNAGATPETILQPIDTRAPSDGTILVGKELVKFMRTLGDEAVFGACMTAVCAHEAGHIVQQKYRDVLAALDASDSDTLDRELHADFLCGVIAAKRRVSRSGYVAFWQPIMQYKMGDKGRVIFPHGTREQRGDAVYAGFVTATDNPNLSPHDMAIAGLKYLDRVHKR